LSRSRNIIKRTPSHQEGRGDFLYPTGKTPVRDPGCYHTVGEHFTGIHITHTLIFFHMLLVLGKSFSCKLF